MDHSLQLGRPRLNDTGHLDEYVLVALTVAFKNPKSVVGGVEWVKRRALAEFFADGLQQLRIRHLVSRPTQEKHRDRDRVEMLRALQIRLVDRFRRLMQGKGKEDQA